MFTSPYLERLYFSGNGIYEEPLIGVYIASFICSSNRRDITQPLLLQVNFSFFSIIVLGSFE